MKRESLVGLVGALLVVAIAAGFAYDLQAANGQALQVMGRVTPSEWKDALGVYTQRWPVEVTVRYGDEIADRWTGETSARGTFRAKVTQAAERPGAVVEVRINGGLVYHNATLRFAPGSSALVQADTIRMQRRY